VRRHDDDREIGVFVTKKLRQGETVESGHSKIDEGDLGLRVVTQLLRF
jgi:hypothetical protein